MTDWNVLLRKIAPQAKSAVLDAIAPHMGLLAEYGVNTPRRQAHFLAQCAHESAGFQTLQEYGGPKYFARYDGRKDLGNVQPGDGNRFHGRGIIQITGRANYASYGKKLGLDLVKEPELAARGDVAVRVACLFWRDHGLSDLADADNVSAITRRINGGLNGLADRKAYLARAKAALKA